MSAELIDPSVSGFVVEGRRRPASVVVGLTALVALIVAGSAAAGTIFYLSARPGMCLIASRTAGSAGQKYVAAVSCTNPRHNFEVFSVEHGGWGRAAVPANAAGLVLELCRASYARATGHVLRAPGGIFGFWPDPGTEQARYGDTVICSFVHYPSYAALGPGRHTR